MAIVVPFLIFVGTALIWLGDLLSIIAVALVRWERQPNALFKVYIGLFKFCIEDRCSDTKGTTSREACRALFIIGIILGAAAGAMALILFLMHLCKKSPKMIFHVFPNIIAGASFLAGVIGLVVYDQGVAKEINVYEESFRMATAGPVLVLVGGIFVSLSMRWIK